MHRAPGIPLRVGAKVQNQDETWSWPVTGSGLPHLLTPQGSGPEPPNVREGGHTCHSESRRPL